LDAGFDIYGRSETGVKQQDFDFYAVRSNQQINVEVTTLTTPLYSDQTLHNALHDKRTQLPKTNASIVFVVFPESWGANPKAKSWKLDASEVCKRFLHGSTRRISAIMLLMEQNIGSANAGTGGFIIHKQAFIHENPYFEIADTNFLFKGIALPSGQKGASEFYRWVDFLLGDGTQ